MDMQRMMFMVDINTDDTNGERKSISDIDIEIFLVKWKKKLNLTI